MYGPERLKNDIKDLGYEIDEKIVSGKTFIILPSYVIEIGRFSNRVIDLGIQATNDFPRTVASSIHIKANPQLFEKSDSVPNIRNITNSKLGPDWLYWSHNFQWLEEKSARRLINQIKGIFANA